MKPRLISKGPLTLHSNWLQPLVCQHFDLVISDSVLDLQSSDCYYTNHWDNEATKLAQRGKKIVIDRLWEPSLRTKDPYGCYVLQNWNWFWYYESLWYRDLGYDQYQPKPQWCYRRKSRDYVVQYLNTNLDRFLWSYQENGKHLPHGGDYEDWSSQRLFQPAWYNTTAISLVMETAAESTGNTVPLISEKTFKPIAFFHPFVVCGDWQSLVHLRNLGFETFENLFDETYDSIKFWKQRCEAAVDQCLAFDSESNTYDVLTQKKLRHNHEHFFDQSLVTKKITTEILEPLRHYAET
jgi:hypothetical protein